MGLHHLSSECPLDRGGHQGEACYEHPWRTERIQRRRTAYRTHRLLSGNPSARPRRAARTSGDPLSIDFSFRAYDGADRRRANRVCRTGSCLRGLLSSPWSPLLCGPPWVVSPLGCEDRGLTPPPWAREGCSDAAWRVPAGGVAFLELVGRTGFARRRMLLYRDNKRGSSTLHVETQGLASRNPASLGNTR